ncbi:MAG: hypothetical protein JHC95_04645 [Solirubrobacteraceae bacterium]|nr:hypothetical protein [Solirubrobacteraceae bacterium]
MSGLELTPRQDELMRTFLSAWEGSGYTPFDLETSTGFSHQKWPPDVPPPEREEVRALVHLDLLSVDKRVPRIWRVFPSQLARDLLADASAPLAVQLSDADQRLGRILDATVSSFEEDPREPLHLAVMDQLTVVEHVGWPLPPDSVRTHDIAQLVDLGLVGTEPRGSDDLAFWPTPGGRSAVKSPATYLDRLADNTEAEPERSRLQEWAGRFRAGEISAGTVSGTVTGLLLKVLIGG